MTELREGDIYFWQWKEVIGWSYHCKSRKAVVRNGCLIDTFWSDMSADRALDPSKIELEFKGNEGDLRKIDDCEAEYYEPEDIVDMRHANHSSAPVYVKPEAMRSQARILEHLRYRRDAAESRIRQARHTIEELDAAIASVTDGKLDGYLP